MTELEKAREEINRIDKQLARLFEERMAAVKTVAEYKKQNGVRVTDLSREAEVIKRNSSLIENEALKPYFVSFLQSNMDWRLNTGGTGFRRSTLILCARAGVSMGGHRESLQERTALSYRQPCFTQKEKRLHNGSRFPFYLGFTF